MNVWLLALGLVALWFAFIALATFIVWRIVHGGRGAAADQMSLEWTEDMQRRDRRLFRAARREELAKYRAAAVAIRGPTSLAEYEVAQILEDQKF